MSRGDCYFIENITEYGKLMAFCIEKDVSVWRTYWDDNQGGRIYQINWQEKRCYYWGSTKHFNEWAKEAGVKAYKPIFAANEFGNIEIVGKEELEWD